jgi:uncharacterized OsmC-like protein
MTKQDDPHGFTILVDRTRDFEFRVQFDKDEYAELMMDEPVPIGHDKGPNATRVLAAAIGNCLSASLMFCLQRSKLEFNSIRAEVTPRIARNEEGRWRVEHINVKIVVNSQEGDSKRFQRCADIFENYCIVTSSIRQGVPVDVTIHREK